MKNVNKDLGQSEKEMYGLVAAPEMKVQEDRVQYPSFHYEGEAELGIPEKGKMTVEYETVSESSSKGRDGKERYACTVEIRKILAVEGEVEQPTKRDTSTSDALDKLVEALSGEESD